MITLLRRCRAMPPRRRATVAGP